MKPTHRTGSGSPCCCICTAELAGLRRRPWADLRIDSGAAGPYRHALPITARTIQGPTRVDDMKVRSSLKSLKGRHRDCKVVRRKGRVYVINKTDPRFKAKQG